MPRVYAADSPGTPEEAWSLMARPSRWAEWAPHVRGAWNLGAPEVETGKVGAAKLMGLVPVPAKITAKQAGRCGRGTSGRWCSSTRCIRRLSAAGW